MDQCVFVDVSSLSFAYLARLPGCFTFFKSHPWCWIQPFFPQLLYLFINVVLCWWQLTFWMVIMIAQSWVDLSFWEKKKLPNKLLLYILFIVLDLYVYIRIYTVHTRKQRFDNVGEIADNLQDCVFSQIFIRYMRCIIPVKQVQMCCFKYQKLSIVT